MTVRIELLAGFRVEIDGAPVPDAAWRKRRPAELVQLLALARARCLHRDAVIDALWPHLAPRAGLANLHKAAHLARKATGAAGAVVLADDHVSLWPDTDVDLDVERFERAARDALRGDDIAACVAAADLYAGELLPRSRERFGEERQRLRSVYLQLLRAAGRWDLLVAEEPADEQAHRELLRRHLDAGDTDAAVRQFHALHAALADLGLCPRPATVELYEQALGDDRRARPGPHRGPLLGRAAELKAARRVLRAATTGEGGTILVEGPPGIGKTRFGLALVDEATDAGWSVVRAAASDTDGAVPYAPVAAAVERLTAARPDLLALLAPPARAALAGLAGGGEGIERARLVAALVGLLVTAAGSGVSLLLVDDAHAADDATLELLGHLANAARFEPLVLVVAYRRHEAPPVLARLEAGLVARRVSVRVGLGLLGAKDAAALACRAAAHEPSQAALAAMWHLAEGNPLFTEELAAAIGPDGMVPEAVDVPEVVAARLAVLPADAREGLARLAVAAGAFARQEVAAVVGSDAAALLDSGLRHGLLVADGDRYRFRHALVREALARSVPEHRRAALHAHVADRLIAAGAAPARIAHHALAAGRDDRTGWLCHAGHDALAVGAYADALAFAERGLAACGDDERRGLHEPRADGPVFAERGLAACGDDQRSRLLELRADALHGLGDLAAGAAYAAALAAADRAAAPALRIKQARACLAVGALDAAEACLDGLEPGRAEDRIGLLLVRALLAWQRDDLDAAERLTAEARALALTTGGHAEVAEALSLEVMLAHTSGERRLTSLSQWMEAYAAPSLASMALDPHLCIADYLLASDQPTATVIDFARRVAEATARTGAVRGEAFATVVLGEAQLAAGELDAAQTSLGQSLDLHRRVGWVAGEAIALEQLAELARCRGDQRRTDRLLAEALEAARWSPLCSHLLARVHATRVRACSGDDALQVVARAEADLADRALCPVCSARFALAAAVACARAGRVASAGRYLDRVDALGAATGRGALGAEVTAARAEVAAADGEGAVARRGFADAAGWFTELGHHPAARACRDRAGVASRVSPG